MEIWQAADIVSISHKIIRVYAVKFRRYTSWKKNFPHWIKILQFGRARRSYPAPQQCCRGLSFGKRGRIVHIWKANIHGNFPFSQVRAFPVNMQDQRVKFQLLSGDLAYYIQIQVIFGFYLSTNATSNAACRSKLRSFALSNPIDSRKRPGVIPSRFF